MTQKVFDVVTCIYDMEQVDVEDGGQALIANIEDENEPELFVRVQSWSPKCEHKTFNEILGRRIRVMIEVLD